MTLGHLKEQHKMEMVVTIRAMSKYEKKALIRKLNARDVKEIKKEGR